MSKSWHQHVVALTGTIGSGKSTVAAILAELGALCISADDLARQAVLPGSPGLSAVVNEFGREILTPNGALDRKKLGEIVFSSTEKRKKLEAITHPIIQQLAEQKFDVIAVDKYPLLVYECPLLFEAGLDKKGFWRVILVSAADEHCIRRIMERDGLTKQQALERLSAQFPVAQKIAGSDIIVDNSRGLPELRIEVTNLFRRLVEEKKIK